MKTLTVSLAAASLLALAPACSDNPEDEPEVADEAQEINSYILSLPDLPIAEYQPKTEVTCGDDCVPEQQEEELFCNYARFTETGHYSQFIAFQPNSAALWPGSVVQGGDAQDGFFTPVGVARAPITFSVSLENIAGSPVGFMKNPSLSSFREERNTILARGVTGATPAAIDFEVTQVHSDSQVSIALGASVLWPGGASVTAGFNFSSHEKKTKILVNYTQSYYTIDIDTPIEPKDFFGEDVTLEELSAFMDSDNPPTSVQSITYGRRVIFTVETNESADKIKAALEAAYEASVDVEAKLDVEYEKALEESTIRAFVLGGSGPRRPVRSAASRG
ncbi:MAG: thiol-activated cytolysin family protein [Deltaproteobacteria bacterium]|nr:thiol-activated cytolysin family protein [Deltaproteobacteria bacterium]